MIDYDQLFIILYRIVKSTGSLSLYFHQCLLASFPPLYSRPKVGYLGSWRRRTFSQGRRKYGWRRTSRFPPLQLAESSAKVARRWAECLECYSISVKAGSQTFMPLKYNTFMLKSGIWMFYCDTSDFYWIDFLVLKWITLRQRAPGWLCFIQDCFGLL